MIKTQNLPEYLQDYIEEKTEIKNLTTETTKKQTFNINQFIKYLQQNQIQKTSKNKSNTTDDTA